MVNVTVHQCSTLRVVHIPFKQGVQVLWSLLEQLKVPLLQRVATVAPLRRSVVDTQELGDGVLENTRKGLENK